MPITDIYHRYIYVFLASVLNMYWKYNDLYILNSQTQEMR